ncbi:MAG: ribosome maturation factor RimM [Actinomyces sp.]|nr:ribosome maturation factor RimM [Actinomyces sp.]MDN6428235.1 ribosome maturation factor RimM [Propionibacterium sp.]MDN6567169.1 ribosome maturation factor RimM [Actinomyces sp.]
MRMTAAVVGAPHGLKGEVYVDIRTDDPERLSPGSVLDTDSPDTPHLTVEALRSHKGRVMATFAEVPDRSAAESLRGCRIVVEEEPEEDAWYAHELVGLQVLTPGGEILGEVVGLRPGAAQDLLLVRHTDRTVMVPFVTALVPTVDLEEGTVTVDAPPGLFDEADAVDAGDRGGAIR